MILHRKRNNFASYNCQFTLILTRRQTEVIDLEKGFKEHFGPSIWNQYLKDFYVV